VLAGTRGAGPRGSRRARSEHRAVVTNNVRDYLPLHNEAITPGGPGHFGMIFMPGAYRRTKVDTGRIVASSTPRSGPARSRSSPRPELTVFSPRAEVRYGYFRPWCAGRGRVVRCAGGPRPALSEGALPGLRPAQRRSPLPRPSSPTPALLSPSSTASSTTPTSSRSKAIPTAIARPRPNANGRLQAPVLVRRGQPRQAARSGGECLRVNQAPSRVRGSTRLHDTGVDVTHRCRVSARRPEYFSGPRRLTYYVSHNTVPG